MITQQGVSVRICIFSPAVVKSGINLLTLPTGAFCTLEELNPPKETSGRRSFGHWAGIIFVNVFGMWSAKTELLEWFSRFQDIYGPFFAANL